MQKPGLWNTFKAGAAYIFVAGLANMILGAFGFGLIALIGMASGTAGIVFAIVGLIILLPLLCMVSGYVQYHTVRWAFGK